MPSTPSKAPGTATQAPASQGFSGATQSPVTGRACMGRWVQAAQARGSAAEGAAARQVQAAAQQKGQDE